jgi:hypothetical protein
MLGAGFCLNFTSKLFQTVGSFGFPSFGFLNTSEFVDVRRIEVSDLSALNRSNLY